LLQLKVPARQQNIRLAATRRAGFHAADPTTSPIGHGRERKTSGLAVPSMAGPDSFQIRNVERRRMPEAGSFV